VTVRTIILCGGKGTRAYPHTLEVPKPLLMVGEAPVLRHVMNTYAGHGFADFVLAGGYRVDLLKEYAADLPASWNVDVVDTGEDAGTGDRIMRCRDLLGQTFFVTYGDGLGNIDIPALLSFHQAHGRDATLTTVPLPSQYGTIDITDDGAVRRFLEKPRLPDHLINAGFMVFEQAALDRCGASDLERAVLPCLAEADQLRARRHEGFWQSLDTYKDAVELSALCEGGPPPWSS
jgi:glucose-1-phosphate cytidylyltransferase